MTKVCGLTFSGFSYGDKFFRKCQHSDLLLSNEDPPIDLHLFVTPPKREKGLRSAVTINKQTTKNSIYTSWDLAGWWLWPYLLVFIAFQGKVDFFTIWHHNVYFPSRSLCPPHCHPSSEDLTDFLPSFLRKLEVVAQLGHCWTLHHFTPSLRSISFHSAADAGIRPHTEWVALKTKEKNEDLYQGSGKLPPEQGRRTPVMKRVECMKGNDCCHGNRQCGLLQQHIPSSIKAWSGFSSSLKSSSPPFWMWGKELFLECLVIHGALNHRETPIGRGEETKAQLRMENSAAAQYYRDLWRLHKWGWVTDSFGGCEGGTFFLMEWDFEAAMSENKGERWGITF